MPLSEHVRPLSELLRDLQHDVATLVRQELELARVELSATAARIGTRVAIVAMGGVLACGGLYAIVAGLVLAAVALGMPPWGAALTVGALVLAVGGFMAWQAVQALRREDLAPRQTVRTLKENVEWVKQQAIR